MNFRSRLLLGVLPLVMSAPLMAAQPASPRVEIETTMGSIVVQLEPSRAPITVKNFLRYVNEGYYSGTIFHRVISGFMIQGGGFTEKMEQKPAHDPIPLEARGGLRNDRYTIAMARTSYPHSATSQFYINVNDNSFLNADEARDGQGYAVFGRVVKGTEVVDKISYVKTGMKRGMSDVPVQTVKILSARVVK
ncbi:MAG: peptidyl-prolyl cis-trans isomerase [Sutterella sp.]|nr:peptidyl-prolyl cis-trans isomerase [Sutterella sp.]